MIPKLLGREQPVEPHNVRMVEVLPHIHALAGGHTDAVQAAHREVLSRGAVRDAVRTRQEVRPARLQRR